jgi:hypothetical protein
MIVGIPNHQELRETGLGWLNLAWETTVEGSKGLEEHIEYYELQTAGPNLRPIQVKQ